MNDKEILERLQNCANDPMWADHAEISKALLNATIALINKLKREAANAETRETDFPRSKDWTGG